MESESKNTHVRYVVNYNGRTYEHPLHSNKRYFIRNIADVVNILEYCVTQDIKKGDVDLSDEQSKLHDFKISRLVNDAEETTEEATFSSIDFNCIMQRVVNLIVKDTKTRNS